MDCPKCVGRLQKTTVTERITSKLKDLQGATETFELEVDKCFACGGVWFDKGELDKYLSDQVTILHSPSLGGKLDQAMDRKYGNCPRCKVRMEKVSAPKKPNLTIDRCPQCQGVWLDPTEIDRLEEANKPRPGFLETLFSGFRRK